MRSLEGENAKVERCVNDAKAERSVDWGYVNRGRPKMDVFQIDFGSRRDTRRVLWNNQDLLTIDWQASQRSRRGER